MTVPDATWWRFEQYEIRDEVLVEQVVKADAIQTIVVVDGDGKRLPFVLVDEKRDLYITPVPVDGGSGSLRLTEFNPWEFLEKKKGGADEPLYLQIRDLVQELPATIRSCHELPESFGEAVCEWCGRYGPLGLLPHNVRSVRIESWQVDRVRWLSNRDELSAKPVESLFRGSVYSYQAGDPFNGGDLFPDEIIVEEFGLGTRPGDVDEEWWPYFPELRSKSSEALRMIVPPDRPASSLFEEVPEESPGGAFWNDYREPLFRFATHAKDFANAIDVLEKPDRPIDEGYGQLLDHRGALERLNQLASVVTHQVRIDVHGKYRHRWVSPSLLGHLAMGAIQGMVLGKSVRECPWCRKVFPTLDSRQEFCGKTCRNRNRQQRYRDGKLQAVKALDL